jgi:hypothetical protein
MLDDLTSGFNIASNITMDKRMNEALGFTEQEVQSIRSRLGLASKAGCDEIKEYYDGYRFNVDSNEMIYNPDMILYYFEKLRKENRPPQKLIDDNVKTDYGRLERLISNERNRTMLESII